MITDLILGTAGHIDHGKTSLIKALTGVDTDRLPEEKKRGITIDLGFAELTVGPYRLGIVDVPGHERFVRNMLAGATGMDLAMLIVAADDSIKQQTREHLDILRMLDLPAGVIVITKCDLVDSDWLQLVEDEVRELVADTFLERAPIVRTSVMSGVGLDELRRELEAAAAIACQVSRRGNFDGPFRMPIDRVFTLPGHGTIVTGSVSTGRVKIDDELIIEPGGIRVRVRSLQNHDRAVSEIHRGQRGAINLSGVRHDELNRGQELATFGHLVPSKLLTAKVSVLKGKARDSSNDFSGETRPIKDRDRLRVHLGTAEILATVRTLTTNLIQPGEESFVQLYLAEPCVCAWNQPIILRTESPVRTIGGGRILDPNADRIRHPDEQTKQQLERLVSEDHVARASASLFFAGVRGWRPDDLPRSAGVDDFADVYRQLKESGECCEITISPTRSIRVHRLYLSLICDRVAAMLAKLHAQNPLRTMLDRQSLVHAFEYLGDKEILSAALEQMRRDKRVQLHDQRVSLVGCGPKLSSGEQKLLAQLVDLHRKAGLQPPTVKECREQAARLQDSVPHLLALAAANGDLVEVCADFYLHVDADRGAKRQLEQSLAHGRGMTVSEIREVLNTTRKYAVPYCEYLDRIGFTHRVDDVRRLAAVPTNDNELSSSIARDTSE